MRKSRVELARELIAARDAAKQEAKQATKAIAKAEGAVEKAVAVTQSAEEKLRSAYLAMARQGLTHAAIATELRLETRKYHRWKMENPEWYEAVGNARRYGREERKRRAEDHLLDAISSGSVDRNSVNAAMFLLKSYEPETFSEGQRFKTPEGKRVEVVIRDGREPEPKALPAEFTVEGG